MILHMNLCIIFPIFTGVSTYTYINTWRSFIIVINEALYYGDVPDTDRNTESAGPSYSSDTANVVIDTLSP